MNILVAEAIVKGNYIYEQIARTAETLLLEPEVVNILTTYFTVHPEVRTQIRKSEVQLSGLLNIINSLPPDQIKQISLWVLQNTNDTLNALIESALNFEVRCPEGAEAIRTVLLSKINAKYP